MSLVKQGFPEAWALSPPLRRIFEFRDSLPLSRNWPRICVSALIFPNAASLTTNFAWNCSEFIAKDGHLRLSSFHFFLLRLRVNSASMRRHKVIRSAFFHFRQTIRGVRLHVS
jgi:hypothetical protein